MAPGAGVVGARSICLTRLHPAPAQVLISNPDAEDAEEDPYTHEEQDPAKCRALESSLWEVQSLEAHYHPDVARLPEILSIPALRKADMDVRRASQTTWVCRQGGLRSLSLSLSLPFSCSCVRACPNFPKEGINFTYG